jgi:hypothetical protein
MILTTCPNSAINRLFSKQNILITDYGLEALIGVRRVFITPDKA